MSKPKSLGERVRVERLRLGISQRELGRRVGMSTSFISKLEFGTRPGAIALSCLANQLGVTMEYLVCGKNPETSIA